MYYTGKNINAFLFMVISTDGTISREELYQELLSTNCGDADELVDLLIEEEYIELNEELETYELCQ